MRKEKKYQVNRKGCGVKSFVKGVRADKAFWDSCEKAALVEGISANALIVYAVKRYCAKILAKGGADDSGK